METFPQTKKLTGSAERITSTSVKTGFWEMAEFNRFGIIPMLLVIVCCVGGGAASYGAYDNLFQLAMVVFSSMICLIAVLAVTPMRVIIFSAIAALVIDGLVLLV